MLILMKSLLKSIFVHVRLFIRKINWRILKLLKNTITIRTKQGIFSVYSKDRVIGKYLFYDREYELDFMIDVANFLNSNGYKLASGTVLDIGANIGTTSIGMIIRNIVSKAISIEPDPNNFKLLIKNIQTNNLKNIIFPIESAVSDSSEKVFFELSDVNYGDHRIKKSNTHEDYILNEKNRNSIEVSSDKLNNLIKMVPDIIVSGINLIWIDVQGFEGYVVKGGEDIFKRNIPTMMEISPYLIKRSGMNLFEYEEILKKYWNNYYIYRRKRFVCYPISVIQNYFEELGSKGGYENVLFIK